MCVCVHVPLYVHVHVPEHVPLHVCVCVCVSVASLALHNFCALCVERTQAVHPDHGSQARRDPSALRLQAAAHNQRHTRVCLVQLHDAVAQEDVAQHHVLGLHKTHVCIFRICNVLSLHVSHVLHTLDMWSVGGGVVCERTPSPQQCRQSRHTLP
jgi:hypothetical protein